MIVAFLRFILNPIITFYMRNARKVDIAFWFTTFTFWEGVVIVAGIVAHQSYGWAGAAAVLAAVLLLSIVKTLQDEGRRNRAAQKAMAGQSKELVEYMQSQIRGRK